MRPAIRLAFYLGRVTIVAAALASMMNIADARPKHYHASTARLRGPILTLTEARALFARSGKGVGAVVRASQGRFVVTGLKSSSPSPNVFHITVTVRPVP